MIRWEIKKRNGFTIVELLIVVVIIAVLAAIVATGYSGIQARARHSAITTSVEQWTKVLRANVNIGKVSFGEGTCLGNSASDFPAIDGYTAGHCSSDGYELATGDIASIRGAGITIANGSLPTVTYDGARWRGLFAFNAGNVIYLMYHLDATTCLETGDAATVSGNAVQCIRRI